MNDEVLLLKELLVDTGLDVEGGGDPPLDEHGAWQLQENQVSESMRESGLVPGTARPELTEDIPMVCGRRICEDITIRLDMGCETSDNAPRQNLGSADLHDGVRLRK